METLNRFHFLNFQQISALRQALCKIFRKLQHSYQADSKTLSLSQAISCTDVVSRFEMEVSPITSVDNVAKLKRNVARLRQRNANFVATLQRSSFIECFTTPFKHCANVASGNILVFLEKLPSFGLYLDPRYVNIRYWELYYFV